MNVQDLSPPNRELLLQALPAGELVNILYEGGQRMDAGFQRERRCFALGERGWLAFVGWDGRLAQASCRSRWTLTEAAHAVLAGQGQAVSARRAKDASQCSPM